MIARNKNKLHLKNSRVSKKLYKCTLSELMLSIDKLNAVCLSVPVVALTPVLQS